jgi:hypothetical protein
MDIFNNALLRGFAAEILPQLQPELPILSGNVIALSTYGRDLYDDAIVWAQQSMTANFIRTQDAPFQIGSYGTVQIVEEPFPLVAPIYREACKVVFNHAYFKKAQRAGILRDVYQDQLVAKVNAWDELCAALITFGNPYTGQPGLLQGSGIPLVTSTVNMTTALPDVVITEFVRLATLTANNSRNVFKPNLIGVPQDLVSILNARSYSANDSKSLWTVIQERLAEAPPYNRSGAKQFQVTAVPQFNDNKIMTVLPDDPELIGAAVWNLEEFYSGHNSEERTEGNMDTLGSAHEGGCAGVIAKRANAGLVATMLY